LDLSKEFRQRKKSSDLSLLPLGEDLRVPLGGMISMIAKGRLLAPPIDLKIHVICRRGGYVGEGFMSKFSLVRRDCRTLYWILAPQPFRLRRCRWSRSSLIHCF